MQCDEDWKFFLFKFWEKCKILQRLYFFLHGLLITCWRVHEQDLNRKSEKRVPAVAPCSKHHEAKSFGWNSCKMELRKDRKLFGSTTLWKIELKAVGAWGPIFDNSIASQLVVFCFLKNLWSWTFLLKIFAIMYWYKVLVAIIHFFNKFYFDLFQILMSKIY